MPLAPGIRLGPYEVLAQLGAGGMGEVYKARDTRLDRVVAIKILPAHLADFPGLRERFEREARTIAQLNHPNICTLYDVGSQDGADFLVLEYLEGETLSERLKRGSLPPEQVLQYAVEIASALDKAHRDGFIHRDIKPANIMLVPGSHGTPSVPRVRSSSPLERPAHTKVLDFGLAKFKQEVAKATTPLSEMPTAQGGLTQHGTLLGTLQYMSPEQIEGRIEEIDHRTDVFAFGALVYEMGTGKRAFPGETQASVIAKVLEHNPPPMSSQQPPGKMTPPALDRVVQRCLAKDPEDRWQSMRDLCHELEWIKESGGSHGMSSMPWARSGSERAPNNLRERLPWAVAVVAILVAIALGLSQLRQVPTDQRTAWLSVLPPSNTTFTPGSAPLISPDGRRLAFLASSSSGTQIWVRPLDSLQAKPLFGTERASYPFWSPDSRFLGFFADGKLKKIDTSGGPVQILAEAPVGLGGTWSRNNIIVFAPRFAGGLFSIPAVGGSASPVTTTSQGELAHMWPSFLPDDRHFLYFSSPGGIYVGSIVSKDTQQILTDQSRAEYSPSGFLLFSRQGALMAQPFRPERLETSGEAFPIAQQLGQDPTWPGSYAFSVSEGALLSYRSTSQEVGQLAWFDRTGKPLGSVGLPGIYRNPRLAPDGTRAAMEKYDENGNRDIWLMDLRRGVPTRFTFDPAFDTYPHWSPDGTRIVFESFRNGYDIYQKLASGGGNEDSILHDSGGQGMHPTDWSSDGRFILYTSADEKGNFHPWALPTFGDRKPFQLLQSEFTEAESQVSPDGRWMAYSSAESGKTEVYIRSFPEPSGKWQVSDGGGAHPRWRRDGRELFYISSDRKMMSAPIRADSTVEVGGPVPLFEASTLIGADVVLGYRQQYDVAPDGQRFLMNVEAEGASAASPFNVILNWQSALQK